MRRITHLHPKPFLSRNVGVRTQLISWILIALPTWAHAREPSISDWIAHLGLDSCATHYPSLMPSSPLAEAVRSSWGGKKHLPLDPEIEILRRVNFEDWAQIPSSSRQRLFGDESIKAWQNAKQFAEAHASDAELGPDLLKKMHLLALEGHYFAGYERRRIQHATQQGKLSASAGMKLLEEIKEGQKPLPSGTDHRSLRGVFRKDPLDAFVQNGRHVLPNGSRYFTASELAQIRKNPFLKVDEGSFKDIGEGRFTGNVHFVAPAELEKAVNSVFKTLETDLKGAKDDLAKISAIVRFRREMLTIHPFLDGNGRSIRLFADLLYLRHGFPPPLTFHENDLIISQEEDVKSTLIGMQLYLMALDKKASTEKR